MSISLRDGGLVRREYTHRLVYETFVGGIPEGMEIRHLNGDPADNRLENLDIGTRTDQRNDDVRNGTHWQAKKSHCKRGHPLRMPFICPTRFKQGHRVCLPCKRAMVRKAKYGYSEAEVRNIADEIYTDLQNGVTL